MAFNIPNKALLTFSTKQCVDTLYRFGKQIDDAWMKEETRTSSLETLKSYLTTFLEHSSLDIQNKAKELLEIFPQDRHSMQNWLMFLERELQLDLKDQDFLISTEDTSERTSQPLCPIHIVLDNLRSSFNVGSFFRSAEALGAFHIHLCGYTPTPENAKTKKSALGTDSWVKWSYWESTLECIEKLKKENIHVYSFETAKEAKLMNEASPIFPCALVFGNERYGLASPVLNISDTILKINLSGKKNSLNVATCGAIALHHFVEEFSSFSKA